MRLNQEAHAAQPTVTGVIEPEESTITSLAVIETTPAALVYAPGALTALVDKLKQEVRGQLAALDVSIPSQRARIVSLSVRVASAKVKLDQLGDSLIEDHRAVVTAVNAARKAMRDDLDAFKIEVRKPLTDLENAETARKAAHEAALTEIAELGTIRVLLSVEDAAARILAVQSAGKRDWQEFKTRADAMRDSAYIVLSEAHEAAKRRQEEAIERERQRVAEEQRKELEEAEKRAKNRAHRATIEEDVRLAMLAHCDSRSSAEDVVKAIIAAIAKGLIPHVSINY